MPRIVPRGRVPAQRRRIGPPRRRRGRVAPRPGPPTVAFGSAGRPANPPGVRAVLRRRLLAELAPAPPTGLPFPSAAGLARSSGGVHDIIVGWRPPAPLGSRFTGNGLSQDPRNRPIHGLPRPHTGGARLAWLRTTFRSCTLREAAIRRAGQNRVNWRRCRWGTVEPPVRKTRPRSRSSGTWLPGWLAVRQAGMARVGKRDAAPCSSVDERHDRVGMRAGPLRPTLSPPSARSAREPRRRGR